MIKKKEMSNSESTVEAPKKTKKSKKRKMNPRAENKVGIGIFVDKEVKELLKELAQREHMTFTTYITKLILEKKVS